MFRFFFELALAAAIGLALMASGAGAAPPTQHYHFAFNCTATPSSGSVYADLNTGACLSEPPKNDAWVQIAANLCEIPGTLADSQSANVQVLADGTYKAEFKETYVFTSGLTGKSIESRADQQQTFTFSTSADVFAFKGLEQQIKLSNGSVLAMDAGSVVFTANGNGFSISENGRHDNLYDRSNLCAAVVPALS